MIGLSHDIVYKKLGISLLTSVENYNYNFIFHLYTALICTLHCGNTKKKVLKFFFKKC